MAISFDEVRIIDTSTAQVFLKGKLVDEIDLETALRNEVEDLIKIGFYKEVKPQE